MKLLSIKKTEDKPVSKNINKTFFYFITFLYAISTGEISPIELFQTAKNGGYGYYSKVMGEGYTLGLDWKYGMSNACEIVYNRIRKSDILTAQLMMKLAQVIRVGESLLLFLKHEFEVTQTLYTAEYNRQVESMKMLMGIYSAIASTATFMIAASMLMSMISGQNGTIIVSLTAFAVILGLGSFVYIMHITFPKDNILNEKGNITKRYHKLFYICIASSVSLSSILTFTNILEPLLAIASAGVPLVILGFYARRLENYVLSMNSWYPTFIRQFGEIYSTVGSIGNALRSTLKNNFGPLSKPLSAMLNRIDNRVTVEDAFDLLSKETGNAMITAGNIIVSTSITKGADMNRVGNIISQVTITLNELYNKRIQVAKVFESTLLIMHILSLSVLSFMSALSLIFSDMFNASSQNVIEFGKIDPAMIDIILPLIVVLLSIINGFATKVARGGLYKTAWFNIGLFMIIGAISVYASDLFIKELLGNVIDLNFNDLYNKP